MSSNLKSLFSLNTCVKQKCYNIPGVTCTALSNIDFVRELSTIKASVLDHHILSSLNELKKPQNKILVEYSSPNIAKPFHVGHLRSTIIGNFISNLNDFLGNTVVRLNYLGDWGTQFGLLKVGVDMSGYTNEMIKQNPIQLLYQAYVIANEKAETDSNITTKAREVFQQMEQGCLQDLEQWKVFRTYTIDELARVYKRLGVEFDEYSWESMYGVKDIQSILEELKTKDILHVDDDGKQVAEINENRRVTLVKSDGTSLYLTRDIAAALDRYKRYTFDRMYYVVDNAQTDHFTALFEIVSRMDLAFANRLTHIKFGRIKGMSTRKGKVVFLKDILDETKEIMYQRQLNSSTTKVPVENLSESSSDVIGVSAVIINDLKQRRQRDYTFDWNKALQVQGDTGVKLQYTHCRLWSLQQNCGASPAENYDEKILKEETAIALLKHISEFHFILLKSHKELESCILVNYLFQLCNLVNKAFKVLPIKGQGEYLGSHRLLLFCNSRLILNQGMKILGLQPLNEM